MKLCCGSAGVAKNRNANCHRKWSGKEFGRLRRSRLRASRLVGPPASPILFDVRTPHHSYAHLRRVSRFATARFVFAPIHTCIDGRTFSHACVVAIQFVRFPNATFPRGPTAKTGRCKGHVFRHVVHVSRVRCDTLLANHNGENVWHNASTRPTVAFASGVDRDVDASADEAVASGGEDVHWRPARRP